MKTVAQKLGIKPGDTVSIDGAVDIGPIEGTLVERGADVAIIAVPNAAALQLERRLPWLAGARAVWFCYPKGNVTDVNRDSIWALLLPLGWRLVANVAIDDVWSAVRARPMTAEELAPDGPTPVGSP